MTLKWSREALGAGFFHTQKKINLYCSWKIKVHKSFFSGDDIWKTVDDDGGRVDDPFELASQVGDGANELPLVRVGTVADPVFEEAEGPDVHVAVRYRPQKAQQTRSGGDLKRKSLTLEKVLKKLNSYLTTIMVVN